MQIRGLAMSGVRARVPEDPETARRLSFLFGGSGELKDMLRATQKKPCRGATRARRNYCAMADIFSLPSSKEGMALVLSEAMAMAMFVIGANVSGQCRTSTV